MARSRAKRIFPIALSVASAAEAMELPPAHIDRAVASGALVAREATGHRVRVTVPDLESWWHATIRAQRNGASHE